MSDLLAAYQLFWPVIGVGIGLMCLAGPLGTVMVWRRMAYFGETLGHSALLGIGIAALLQWHYYIGLFGIALLMACLLSLFAKRPNLANDTILGIIAHSSLALALIIMTLQPERQVALLGFLYGDILAVNKTDVWVMLVIVASVWAILYKLWPNLLAITIAEPLARVEGCKVGRTKLLFVVLLALVYAVAIKLVGVLLITALLIIPPAAARQFARSPNQMALFATLVGIVSLLIGLSLSLYLDWPTGPAIVLAAFVLFLCSFVLKWQASST